MPHSSGQRQGRRRNMPEMPHSVSPRRTVYSSGAVAESSLNGTPCCATCWAVARCVDVIGKLPWACSVDSPASSMAPTAQVRALENAVISLPLLIWPQHGSR
ncbi:hypothetical protein D3C71_1652900 [compost metagenome]